VSLDEESIRNRIQRLKSLPTLPGIFEKITGLMESSDTAAEDVANLISCDQALSARVLRVVNSALYGFPGRISNVTHALIILGFDVVKGLVLSTSVFDMMLARGFYGLWEHSLGCATTAGVIARKTNTANPEEVSVAGLLHDIGKVIIRIELPEEASRIDELIGTRELSVYEAEEEVLGFNHATVGKWLSQKWNLPDKLSDPVTYHHSPALSRFAPRSTAIVHVADSIVRAMGFGCAGDNLVTQIDSNAWEMLEISDPILEEIIMEVDDKLEDAEDFLSGFGS